VEENSKEVVLSKNEYDSIFKIQREILNSIASGVESKILLEMLCKLAEQLLPNSVASIMYVNEKTGLISILSAPSVPKQGHLALTNLKPGPGSGSCGNAIFRNEATFVVDTFSDPKWKDLRQLAYDFNICSCWSMPVHDGNQKPIGTFALSSFEHRQPSQFHKALLETCANIVYIILKNDNQEKIISQDESRIRLFSRALQSSTEGIFITDIDNNIIEINDAFTKIYGYKKDEVIGKNPRIFFTGKNSKKFYKDLWEKLNASGYWRGEIVNKTKKGKEITQWVTISSICDTSGTLQNYLALLTDITQVKKSEEKVAYLAYHDSLTGLYNNTYLQKQKIDDFLLLLNVDNFSYVNLAYGFEIGDKLLVAISNELKGLCQEQDIYRIDSDEFAINYSEDIETYKKIERIQKHFNKISFYIDEISLNITFTYGASEGKSTSLYHSALALKKAKEIGKNRYYIYSKEDDYAEQNQRKEFLKYNGILHNALKYDLIQPFFQGIRDNKTKKIDKYEALVRIVDEDEITTPYMFLQTAKLSGLLPQITKIMIDKSFKYMSKNDMQFSLNITEDDLSQNYLEAFLLKMAFRYKVDTNRVVLEILEGISANGKKNHLKQLNALKRQGFLIAIDDFGAEYSNFERVLDLDIDFLKIDAKYIKNIDTDSRSYEIVKSIVYFAKNTNIPCIAEFVHNKNVQKIVEELGIEYSQGFYFSEPKDTILDV